MDRTGLALMGFGFVAIRLVRDLKQGGSSFNRPSSLAVIVALTLAAVGLAMAINLDSVGAPKEEVLEKLERKK